MSNIPVTEMFIPPYCHVFPHTYTGYPQNYAALSDKYLFSNQFYILRADLLVFLWIYPLKTAASFGDKSSFSRLRYKSALYNQLPSSLPPAFTTLVPMLVIVISY